MNRTTPAATRLPQDGSASPFLSPRLQQIAPPLFLFVLALVSVALYDPLHRPLYQDPGIFAFLSQLVAQGFAPHQSAFNEQSSLAFLFGGSAMWLGSVFGLHPLIAYRIASMLVVGAVVVLTYAVGKMFAQSTFVGLFAGLILLGFQGYIMRAATTLEPKSFMLVFGLAALYCLSKRQWFWAGVLACTAGLAWQIAWGYLIVAVLLALLQGGILLSERARALGLTLLGAAGVFLLYFLFFVAHNAQVEMLQQTFIAPFVMHDVVNMPFTARLFKVGRMFYRGFGAHTLFGILGVSGLTLWFIRIVAGKQWRGAVLRLVDVLFQEPRTAGTLLVIFGFVTNSMLDFQNYPDWIPLLPYVATFAAIFLERVLHFVFGRVEPLKAFQTVGLVAVAVLVLCFSLYQTVDGSRRGLRNTWQEQQRIADELNQQIPASEPIWLLGKADLLFFMRRQNLNKYIYLLGRVDAAADAFEPGGFDTMFRSALNQKPALYVLSRFKAGKFSTRAHFELVKNSTKGYVLLKRCKTVGAGQFYTLPNLAETVFAKSTGCLTR